MISVFRKNNDYPISLITILSFSQRMTFTEFCELLPMVTKHSLYEVDAELVPLHNMPISWYNGLAKVLINKNLHNHRIFTNQDELVKYVVSHAPLMTAR